MPKWLIYSTISLLSWAIWSLLSSLGSRDLSGSMIQILSSSGLIPFALLLLFSKNLRKATHMGKGLMLAFSTGITAGLGNVMLYTALGRNGPVSLVLPIISLAPLIPVLVAPFLLKEKIRGLQALGVAVALIAILLLNTSPSFLPRVAGFSLVSEWMLYMLLAVLTYGITFITQKGATYFISDELSTVAYTISFVLLSIFLLLTDRSLSWNIPTKAGWISVLIGILMGVGSLTLFAAYRYGKAAIVTPFTNAGETSEILTPEPHPWADAAYGFAHPSIVSTNRNLSALRGAGSAETTGEDNLKTMRLVHLALESARCNQVLPV